MMMLIQEGKSKMPKKTKMLSVLNKGDHIVIAGGSGVASILFASGKMNDSSWQGFHIHSSAVEEMKKLRDALDKVVKALETK